MRFSTVAFTLFGAAASASASSLIARQTNPYPDCATPCIASANLGTCSVQDTHCLCTSPAFVNSTTTCIETSCSGADLQKAISVSQQLCAAVGVTLTSSATSGPSTTGSPSSTPTTPASTTSSSTSTSSTTSATNTPAPTSGAGSSRSVNALVGLAAAAAAVFALAL